MIEIKRETELLLDELKVDFEYLPSPQQDLNKRLIGALMRSYNKIITERIETQRLKEENVKIRKENWRLQNQVDYFLGYKG